MKLHLKTVKEQHQDHADLLKMYGVQYQDHPRAKPPGDYNRAIRMGMAPVPQSRGGTVGYDDVQVNGTASFGSVNGRKMPFRAS